MTYIKYILFIVSIISIIIWSKSCNNKIDVVKDNDTIVVVDTQWVEKEVETPVYVPDIRYVERPVYLPGKIDTQYVIGDYYSKYYYEDSIKNEDVTIIIKDSVTQNKISSRQVKYSICYPVISTNTTVFAQNQRIYAGISTNFNASGISYIGTDITFKTKKDRLFSIGGGVNNQLVPVISAKIGWRIK